MAACALDGRELEAQRIQYLTLLELAQGRQVRKLQAGDAVAPELNAGNKALSVTGRQPMQRRLWIGAQEILQLGPRLNSFGHVRLFTLIDCTSPPRDAKVADRTTRLRIEFTNSPPSW